MIVDRAPASYRVFGPIGFGLGQVPAGPPVQCADGSLVQYTSQCPGASDTFAPPSMLTAALSPTQLAALSAYNAAYFGQTSPYALPTPPGALTAALNANPSLVYWGLGFLVVLAFLSEGRR